MRRSWHRLLRVRNLAALAAVLLVACGLRRWAAPEPPAVVSPLRIMSGVKIPIFVPTSLKNRLLTKLQFSNQSERIVVSLADDSAVQKDFNKKIDWHNYTQIELDAKRTGIGEQGQPASLPPSEAALEQSLYAVNGFNGALSDKIPLNRSLRDIRHEECRTRQYIESLPTVSVVVPFHNEHWSTLLRTVQSVVDRSPAHLLREVLLVDDASTKPFLKSQLEEYLAAHLPLARVLRLGARRGLIAARLAGARAAAAHALVFLDSHTEAGANWLPPLLEPIARDYRTVVCPFIDVIDYDTFEYRAQDEGARGAFDWELFYKRLPVLPRDLARMPAPFPSPVMAGGLFAISRAWFWQLGGYDPGLDIWGGEQYELSFKIWQCGGRMLDAPCSRVGHIYRKFAPFPNPNHGDFVGKNYRRVAEVWMDEYAEHLYRRRPHYRAIDPGDLTEQRAVRAGLRCRPFHWFMTQVAFDLTAKYPPVEPPPFGKGQISPMSAPELCADACHGSDKDVLQLRPCRDGLAEQQWELSWHKDIRLQSRLVCWDLPEAAAGSGVRLYACHLGGGNQEWRLDPTTHQIRKSGSVCAASAPAQGAVVAAACDARAPDQRWRVTRLDAPRLARGEEPRARDAAAGPDWYRGD